MKIHEYQAIEIFKKSGIPVASGKVATEAEEAAAIAEESGYPVVLKSQVLVGGRGKAGGIKVVEDKKTLISTFTQIRQLRIGDYPVEKVAVVSAVDIKKEFYVGITIDPSKNDVVLIASAEGGVEIEEVAKTNPDAIKKYYLKRNKTIDFEDISAFIAEIFQDKRHQEIAADIFQKLVNVFFELDCSLAEINPLVIDGEGNLLAADAKINFDENALESHPEIAEMRDLTYEDADEMDAKEKNLSFVKLDGNVGCIVNGAGLAMATMDIVKLSGGNPANFLDVGGSSNPEKVLNALNIILRNKDIKAILINIFGGITRCDDIANGIIQAKSQIDLPVPLVVRLTGTNEQEAKEILSQNGIETYPTMREAVEKVVALANN